MDGNELRAILERHGIDLPPKKDLDEAEEDSTQEALANSAASNGNHSVDEQSSEDAGSTAEELEPPLP